MNKVFLTVLVFLSVSKMHVSAQGYVDNALLFSRNRGGGSARIQAMGGAQVALGGDYSSAFSNPAGLGMFNRSEFTLSLGLHSLSTDASYLGSSSSDNQTTLNIPGFSYVAHKSREKGKFLGGAFGISLNRINDFNVRYSYEGDNTQSSILDFFNEDAGLYDPNEMFVGGNDFYNVTSLAFNNFLISPFFQPDGSTIWDSELFPFQNDRPIMRQSEQIKRRGAQSQLSLSYGANFDDTFFVGATLGIATVRFIQTQVYAESDFRYPLNPGFNPITGFQLEENFDIDATGVNFTLGGIYRPVNFLQVGASFTTPTVFGFSDSYFASMSSQWNNFPYPGQQLPLRNVSEEFDVPLIGEYQLRTPVKLSAGITFINKRGLLTADVEYINYANASYRSTNENDEEIIDRSNTSIKRFYLTAVNTRIGCEFRHKTWRFRAGYGLMTDPFREQFREVDLRQHAISGGVGFRKENIFVDFAMVYSQRPGNRIPYELSNRFIPTADLSFTTRNYMFTIGFPF